MFAGSLVVFVIIGAVILSLIGFVIALYNGLVKLKVLVEEAWSGIDVQLKRRYDLIPNIVETVKGYAKHEKGTFEKIAELRSAAMKTESVEEKGKIEGELTATLKTLFAVAENYPQLKADANFLDLQKTLQTIEEEIQGARRYYNGAVREFNLKLAVFPNNLIGGLLGFKNKEFFEAEETEKQNVKVDFSETETK